MYLPDKYIKPYYAPANYRNTVLQTLPHSFLKLSPTTMLYIPLTDSELYKCCLWYKKYMSFDNFCKQHSAVLLYFAAGFLLSINVTSVFGGHKCWKLTKNEFLQTAFCFPSLKLSYHCTLYPKGVQCQLIIVTLYHVISLARRIASKQGCHET